MFLNNKIYKLMYSIKYYNKQYSITHVQEKLCFARNPSVTALMEQDRATKKQKKLENLSFVHSTGKYIQQINTLSRSGTYAH